MPALVAGMVAGADRSRDMWLLRQQRTVDVMAGNGAAPLSGVTGRNARSSADAVASRTVEDPGSRGASHEMAHWGIHPGPVAVDE